MIDTSCSQCNRTGQILSTKGLCWHCHNTKEKENYRYIINSKTLLLLSTSLLCILFLLNAIPAIRLGHEFTQNYSKITNNYIRYGKDYIFLLLYLVLKISFVISIWKARYTHIGSKYLNLLTEFIVFIIKLVILNQFLASPLKVELKLSELIQLISKYTEETLSSVYIALFLYYSFIFLMIRICSCIVAYIINLFCQTYFKNFYDQQPNQKRINNIAHWDFYYLKHPDFYKKEESLLVATKSEKTMPIEEDDLRKDLSKYMKQDDKKLNHYVQYLMSQDDTISIRPNELDTYLTYIKDKISVWKEDHLATENYINSEIISTINAKFNVIRDRYQSCSIENETYFNIYNHYQQAFDGPLKTITNKRLEVKQSIEQLYMYSDMLYWESKCKENLSKMAELFEKQAINLMDYCALFHDETIDIDSVLITNRGIFLIDIETFDANAPFELVIERDGNWYKRFHDEDQAERLESLSTTITSYNNNCLLKLEKHLNQLLNRPLDQYLELKGIVVLANDEIVLTNKSTQTVIRPAELISVLRSYPIIFNEEQMLHIKSILVSQQVPTQNLNLPNYRLEIIDALDTLLEQKIELIQSNTDLIQKIDAISTNIKKKARFTYLPLYLTNSRSIKHQAPASVE